MGDIQAVGEAQAREYLVRRYLAGFGPATIGDLSSWAGVSVADLRPVIEQMTLRTFRGADGGEVLELPRQPRPDPEAPAPARFLPTWDATLLAHARRTLFLPEEEYRSAVFNTRTQSLTTFLVDGAVAGSWRHEGTRVKLEPFAPLPRAARREVEEEAGRLAAFLAD